MRPTGMPPIARAGTFGRGASIPAVRPATLMDGTALRRAESCAGRTSESARVVAVVQCGGALQRCERVYRTGMDRVESAMVQTELERISSEWRDASGTCGHPTVHPHWQTPGCRIVRTIPGGRNSPPAVTPERRPPNSCGHRTHPATLGF
jgi:hypothetical protein